MHQGCFSGSCPQKLNRRDKKLLAKYRGGCWGGRAIWAGGTEFANLEGAKTASVARRQRPAWGRGCTRRMSLSPLVHSGIWNVTVKATKSQCKVSAKQRDY